MGRADIPTAQWERLWPDPNGWHVRYMQKNIVLGEPAFMKGNTPCDTYADANHIMFDDSIVNQIQIRKQGQNPIEIAIGGGTDINGNPLPPVWKPILEQPYYGPVDAQGQPKKPVFESTSVWAKWNT